MALALDIALSMQKGLQSKIDMIADNIANEGNYGNKEKQIIFSEFLGARNAKDAPSYLNDIATVRKLAPGPLERTGDKFHLALQGQGYFAIQTPNGINYTRSGAFMLDNNNRLIDPFGNPVLSMDGGEIAIPVESQDIQVASDGTINDENGIIARVGVFGFQNEQMMQEIGNNYLQTDEAAVPLEADALVFAGALEKSNGNPVKNVSSLLDATRLYTVNQRIIEEQFKLASKQTDQLAILPPGA